MHWGIAAPFFHGGEDRWLDDFVPLSGHTFQKIPSRGVSQKNSWHNRLSRRAPLRNWGDYWDQAGRAWSSTADGYVTVFPQLALTLATRKMIARKDRPLIAWCFNVGAAPIQPLRILGSKVFTAIDHFVVHSRGEADIIASWFNIDARRISYTPLQRAEIPVYAQEDQEMPFILAMGSAHRDYRTFIDAVAPLKIKTVIVAAAHALEGIPLPENVEWRRGLTAAECHALAQRARVNIIPLKPNPTAVGQVTIVEAMRMGRALIATDGVGSRDYIDSGNNGLLVPPGDAKALRSAVALLWSDAALRHRMERNAHGYAELNFSDIRAGNFLSNIIDNVTR